jgi:hypothetical protein
MGMNFKHLVGETLGMQSQIGGDVMSVRKITREEQECISNCIFEHWGDTEDQRDPEDRDRHYMQCLEECRICG